MTELAWVAVGLLAGLLGAVLPGLSAAQRVMAFAAGLVGGIGGSWLFQPFGAPGVLGVDVWSPALGFVVAIGVLLYVRGYWRSRA